MKRWAGTINVRSGILHDILRMMTVTAKSKSDFDKLCVVSFDEMKVQETYEFDEKAQEFVGPHKQMQVQWAYGILFIGMIQIYKYSYSIGCN